jgi:hypothetical protein
MLSSFIQLARRGLQCGPAQEKRMKIRRDIYLSGQGVI